MATTFDDWLRQLTAANKGPVDLPAATRGLAWSQPIQLAGDWTGATLTGAIRLYPDAPTAVANFSMVGPSVAGGFSTWTASLASGSGGNSTGALPGDDAFEGSVKLPYSFHLTPSGGAADLLFGGSFTVLGKV